MAVDAIALHVVLVVFVATLIRSTFGFGEALVAVPLLALRLPIRVPAPLAVLVSITVAAVVVVQDWRKVHGSSAAWLVLATLAGIPAGLWFLREIDPRLVKAILAFVILSFALHSLTSRSPLHLPKENIAWLLGCGLVAGVLGGAYGMNGPPLVVYGSLRRWSAERFRATLQAYFLPASLVGMAGYWLAGLWVPLVTHYYLLSLPGVAVAIALGRVLNRRLHGRGFLRYAYGGLVAVSFALFAQAVAAG